MKEPKIILTDAYEKAIKVASAGSFDKQMRYKPNTQTLKCGTCSNTTVIAIKKTKKRITKQAINKKITQFAG